MAFDCDLVVLGGGPAGEKAAAQAAYFGKRVVVVERAPEPGGAAVHTGTLPSKTLRETALALSGHRQRELYGVSLAFDRASAVPRLMSRKDAVRGLEVERIRWNLDRHGVRLVHGAARLVDPHTVAVRGASGETRISGEFVLVATGSRPFQPPDIPFEDPDIDDSDTILELDRMPATMTILGGGVIGCEYACMFAEMGVRVALVEAREKLLPFLDGEIGDRLRQAMVALGVDLRMGDPWRAVVRAGDRIVARLASGAEVAAEKLLYAAGRSGAIEGLGLAELGVELTSRGTIVVDDRFRTRVPSVLAAGDVVGFPALASTSMEQGRVAVCHAFGFAYKQHVGELLPYGIYTIPEVSCVGLGEEEARRRDVPYVVGRGFYRDNARAKILGDLEGLVKLVFDRRDMKLVGCHCLGTGAAELVHVGSAMLTLGGGVETLIEMVFNYPTAAECFKYAAYDALGNARAKG